MSASSPYFLARHAFVCVSGSYTVILDLNSDRYFALDEIQARSLATIVAGWPISADTEGVAADRSTVRELVSARLITSNHDDGKEATPIQVEPAVYELNSDAFSSECHISWYDLARFARATLFAAFLRKCLPLRFVIHRIERRAKVGRRREHFDLDSAREVVTKFERLRPLTFKARDACLFEAIALAEFMAAYRIYPKMVFGVRTSPFAAHCWLQRDQIVLNDTAERVCEYTPVMVV